MENQSTYKSLERPLSTCDSILGGWLCFFVNLMHDTI